MKTLLVSAVLVILAVAILRNLERKLIFFPMKEIAATPHDAGLEYEDVEFSSSDRTRLHGWFIPNAQAVFTVLLCHGNAGNISHRIEKALILRDAGAQVFLFDYRGYGKSSGTPGEAGIYKDTLAAYEFLVNERRVAPGRIVVYGESIGGAAAVALAVRVSVRAVITENTFTSIPDMAKTAFGFFPSFLLPTRMDTLSRIRGLGCDKLIIHAKDDEIVPFAFGRKLYEAASEPKAFLEIRGGHNTAYFESEDEYRKGLKEFLASLV